MQSNPLSGEERRQLIDAQQAWRVWRQLDGDRRRRFLGGMRWGERESGDYLLRKTGRSEVSLGPRSPETEKAYRAFMEGRAANRELLQGVSAKLDRMAPVNRAMGLGRMPVTAARILRECDAKDLLGEQIFLVGTNALYAYEAMAGVRFDSGLLATADIDLLLDARRRMSVVARGELDETGLIGLLRRADKSFALMGSRSYRAANKDGYLVDLICPQPKNAVRGGGKKSLSARDDDFEGAEIFGLDWLVNAPKAETVVIDERGYPAPVAAIDPRVYALHKFWMAAREDRSRVKAARDLAQAEAVAHVAANALNLDFAGADLSAMPAPLRRIPAGLSARKPEGGETPDW